MCTIYKSDSAQLFALVIPPLQYTASPGNWLLLQTGRAHQILHCTIYSFPHNSQYNGRKGVLFLHYHLLEGTAHYAGLLLPPAEIFAPGFFTIRAKTKKAISAVFAYFRRFLVYSSNLSNG